MIVDQRTDMAEWVREEQANLWQELLDAIRSAANGAWSMKSANVARRIIEAARLVGPTPHGEAPWALTAAGIYETLLGIGGIDVDLPDEAEWRRIEELMAEHGPSREAARIQFAQTIAHMTSPGEARYIRDGEE